MSKNIYISEKQLSSLISESIKSTLLEYGNEERKSLETIDFNNLMLWVKRNYPNKPEYIQKIIANKIIDAQKRKYKSEVKNFNGAYLIMPKKCKINGESLRAAPMCFPCGNLDTEMNNDGGCLWIEPKFAAYINGYKIKDGRYPCQYNGKECTLYVGTIMNSSKKNPMLRKGLHAGLCRYNDDTGAFQYIQSLFGNVESKPSFTNSFR